MNDEFDEVLAKALRRVDAPPDLAARIMAAATPRSTAKLLIMPRVRSWMGGAIAAALVMGCLIAERVHVVHRQEQAAATEQQFEKAISVTDRALNHTQAQLQRAGFSLTGN